MFREGKHVTGRNKYRKQTHRIQAEYASWLSGKAARTARVASTATKNMYPLYARYSCTFAKCFGLPFFSPSELVFLTLPFFFNPQTLLGNRRREHCFSNPEKSFLFNPSPCFSLRLPCFVHPPPCFVSPASLLVSPRNLVFLSLNLKQPKPSPHPTQTNPNQP